MGLIWGYNPIKPTAERTAKEEVAAFEQHALRGVRHYFVSRVLSLTFVVVLISPFYLAFRLASTMGAAGYIIGFGAGITVVYSYARIMWQLFRA